MNKLRSISLLIGLCLISMVTQVAWSQDSVKIHATDGSTWLDSMWIGTHTSATDCIDGSRGEFEAPPKTPTGVADFRSVNLTGMTCLGQGLQGKDIRGIVIQTETDTFKLGFKSSTEGGAVTLSWSATIGSIGEGYWKLKDASGLSLFADVDMTTTTSFTHPFASTSNQYVYIIKGDGTKMRSFTYNQVATAVDSKGKQKAQKRVKAGKPDFMPNVNNVLEEIYLQGGSVAIGKTGNAKSISHPKFGDVMKSVNKKGILHTNAARCLDVYDKNAKPIAKLVKSLPPDKHNNKLLGAAIALKVNIEASAKGKTQAGFGSLVYNNPGNPYHGQTVSQIMTKLHDFMSCDTTALKGGGTAADLFNVVEAINAAFSGTFDTLSWGLKGVGKLSVKGVKALAEQSLLYRVSAATPEITPVLPSVEAVPEKYGLSQNYPNPFNPTTTIQFDLAEDAFVTLKIYNAIGQEVTTLLDREELYSGDQEVDFDAAGLPSGVYFYRLVANGIGDAEEGIAGQTYVSTMKMLLMK